MWYAISLLTLSEAVTCPTYKCTTQSSTTLECIAHKVDSGVDSYTITPCEDGYLCQYTAGQSSSCTSYPTKTRYPGEFCSDNIDCISNDCLGGMCIGIGATSAATCATTADCSAGLYCNSKFACVEQLADGEACTADDQCSNDHVCDGLACTLMFSKAVDVTTTSVSGTFAYACGTGYAASNNGVMKCALAPNSINTMVTACPESGFCTSFDGKVNKACECAYNGKSYCPLFEGDIQVIEMINLWKKLFDYSNQFCNGMSRWSYACFFEGSSYADYLNWSLKKILYFDGLWYKNVNVQDCVSNTILLDSRDLELDYQLVAHELYKCPVYEEITKKPVTWVTDQCIDYSKNIYSNIVKEIYQYYPCSKGTCTGTTNSDSICMTSNTESRLPGEYCSTGTDCQSTICKSHRCVGQIVNQECNGLTLHCNQGLYCDPATAKCLAVSLTTCTTDDQCNSTSLCLNSKCTLKFSIINGFEGVVTIGSHYGYSESCVSGFAELDPETDLVTCSEAPVSLNNKPFMECTPGSETTDSTGYYNLACQCSYDGKGYYPAFPGDYNGAYIKSAKEHFFSFAKKTSCYMNQFSSLCLKHDSDLLEDYYYYYYAVDKITRGYLSVNAKSFAVKLFSYELYNAMDYVDESSSSSSSSFATGLVLSALAYFTLV